MYFNLRIFIGCSICCFRHWIHKAELSLDELARDRDPQIRAAAVPAQRKSSRSSFSLPPPGNFELVPSCQAVPPVTMSASKNSSALPQSGGKRGRPPRGTRSFQSAACPSPNSRPTTAPPPGARSSPPRRGVGGKLMGGGRVGT